MNSIKRFFLKIKKYFEYPDPKKHCETYVKKGCDYIDGPVCNFPKCDANGGEIKKMYYGEKD